MLDSHISADHVKVVPIEWTAVIGKAEELSAQHTMKEGFRAFDLLHLATALHFKASEFLTFDLKQRKLAEKLGFVVPL